MCSELVTLRSVWCYKTTHQNHFHLQNGGSHPQSLPAWRPAPTQHSLNHYIPQLNNHLRAIFPSCESTNYVLTILCYGVRPFLWHGSTWPDALHISSDICSRQLVRSFSSFSCLLQCLSVSICIVQQEEKLCPYWNFPGTVKFARSREGQVCACIFALWCADSFT